MLFSLLVVEPCGLFLKEWCWLPLFYSTSVSCALLRLRLALPIYVDPFQQSMVCSDSVQGMNFSQSAGLPSSQEDWLYSYFCLTIKLNSMIEGKKRIAWREIFQNFILLGKIWGGRASSWQALFRPTKITSLGSCFLFIRWTTTTLWSL